MGSSATSWRNWPRRFLAHDIHLSVPTWWRRRSRRDDSSISCIVVPGSMYKVVEFRKGLGQVRRFKKREE